MRRVVLLLLLLLAPSPAHAAPPDDPAVRQAVDDALAWLEAHVLEDRLDCEGIQCRDSLSETTEMVVAGGLDVRAWPAEGPSLYDRMRVPDNTRAGQKHPDDPTRELYAATHTGYDPRDFHGRDLWAQARDATDAVIESGHSGYLSFLLMTLTDDPDGVDHADRVADALRGVSWNCSAAPSSDCISFAITALAHHGSLDDVTAHRAFGELAAYRTSDGGYRSMAYDAASNTNSAAWALTAHLAAGRPADPETLGYLLGMQAPDGSFYHDAQARAGDDRVRNFVATVDALVALAGGHPLPGFASPTLPATLPVGVPATLELDDRFTNATWTFPDATLHGTRATRTLSHLGDHTLHLAARGDGVQYRGTVTLQATNAAPRVHLPNGLDADRLTPLRLDPLVTDPDGHAPTATYRLGDRAGTLPADLHFTTPGTHALQVTATDGWGGTAVATTTVTVRNHPPVIDAVTLPATVEAGEPFTTTVEGHDRDGPAPRAVWRLGEREQEGTTVTWEPAAGEHALTVTLHDADGATASSRHTVTAVAGAPPPEPPPTVQDLDVRVDGGRLHVDATVDPPGASLRLAWTVDGAPFSRDAVTLPRSEPLPDGARVVDAVRLTAATTGGEAHGDAGPLPVLPAAADAPGPEPEPADAPPRVDGLQARIDGGTLTVTASVHPPGARVDLAVLLDGVGTIHRGATLPHTQALHPAVREVQVHLVATAHGQVAAARLGPVPVDPAPPAPAPGPEPPAEVPAVTTSTPGVPLPLALLALAVLAVLRRRP